MKSTFVITCAARTGSTMLRYLLDSHPQICCHGEAFIRQGYLRFIFKNRRSFGLAPGYKEFAPSYKSKPIEEFLTEDFLHSSDDGIRAVGFKFKTDEYFDPGYTEISRYLKSKDQIKVIHLRRQDLLAQYISYVFVDKKYNPTVSFDKLNTIKTKKITVKRKHLFNYLDLVTKREEDIISELGHHDIYDIWYEDLVRDRDDILSPLLQFLKVDEISLESSTNKLIKDYSQHIANLSEVYQWMTDSAYTQRINKAQV